MNNKNKSLSPEKALDLLAKYDENDHRMNSENKHLQESKTGKNTTEKLIHYQIPEVCKSLNHNQIAFANELFKTKSVKKSAQKVGYHLQHAYNLRKDIRLQLYLQYLSAEHARNAEIGYSELIERLAERFFDDDKPLDDSDLPKFSKEIRELKQDIKGRQPATSVSIKLPDTYNQFFNVPEKNSKDIELQDLQEIETTKPNVTTNDV
jgi:hypothetical protein